MIDRDHIAYICGLIDGEGYIGICGNPQTNLRPIIALGMTDQKTVDLVSEFLTSKTYPYQAKGNRKREYHTQLENLGKIYFVLETIGPFLKTKHRQAELLLEYCSLRLRDRQISRKHPYTDEEIAIYNELKILNKRGKLNAQI
jgi:hypothetical protein